jgi:hypothetical protein
VPVEKTHQHVLVSLLCLALDHCWGDDAETEEADLAEPSLEGEGIKLDIVSYH